MNYRHLTTDQRSQMAALKSTGMTQKEIGKRLRVSPGTVSRELRRNHGLLSYDGPAAQSKAEIRRAQASQKPRHLTVQVLSKIEECLKLGWSPEQIAGVLRSNGIPVTHQSIYRHIREDRRRGGSLYTYLRHRGKRYKNKCSKGAGRGSIPNRTGIEDRPEIVATKTRVGDFEGDTIIGAGHQGVLYTMVDKATKFVLIEQMKGKYAEQVPEVIQRCLARLPRTIEVKTLTLDNGKEFSKHEGITALTGLACFFARPYCSTDRGLNEHTNGLIRGYFPKGMRLDLLTKEKIQYVEDALNNRPRKVLGYRTPRGPIQPRSATF